MDTWILTARTKVMDLKWQQCAVGAIFGGIVLWTVHRQVTRSARKRSLKDKVVCVTGATGGLGKALVDVLRKRGAKTVITGRKREVLDSIINSQINSEGIPSITVELDLNDLDSMKSKGQVILQAYGHVDVLIHNAGVASRGPAIETAFSVDLDVMKTNYLAPVALTKEILPSMIASQDGCIVAISSIQGKLSIPYRTAYSASKHAMQAFFDCIRAELVDDNVDVLVISPGYIRTGMSINALRGQGVAHAKMDEGTANGVDPEYIAEQTVRAIERRERDVILCEFLPKFAVMIRTFWPSLYFGIMAKRARKYRAEEMA